MQGTMTVRAAAQELQVGTNYLYTLIWSGKLKAEQSGGEWRVDRQSVEERLEARKQREKKPA
jgi:excisionase family DNA binding protein